MTPFSLFAPAKINLALHVLGRRADGYHDLDSIVAFADVGDELTFRPSSSFEVAVSGRFASDLPPQSGNIISRAWLAAAEIAAGRGTTLPPVRVELRKNLPVASGIGGGSANAAAALRGFLRLVDIEPSGPEVTAAALALGADVPVCLLGRPCRMRGVGEDLTPLAGFAPLRAFLVNPMVAVSTPDVFSALNLARGQTYRGAIADEHDPTHWRNDLTAPAVRLAPIIGDVLSRLSALPGIERVLMSGSGATCVALCAGDDVVPELDPAWWVAPTVIS